MRYLILTVTCLFGAAQPVSAAEQPHVVIQNHLSKCLSASRADISSSSGLLTAEADITLREPIGACGCFSSLASYQSTVYINGASQLLQEGLIDLKSGGRKIFVLSTEPGLIKGEEPRLRISCAPPL
ncbi:DUF2195 family protein [Ochrobactrum sp. Marseille-Q0166]|nr:DUF2195 family protein [Ochrobactrum sp. Marseille-Q0166]